MKRFLLLWGSFLVLFQYTLADEIQRISLDDRIMKLETEFQNRLKKLETEMHEKDRKNQYLENQVNDTLRKMMEEVSTVANNLTKESSTTETETASEYENDDQPNYSFNSQYDIPPRAVAEPIAFYAYLSSSHSPKCFNDQETIKYDITVTDTSGSYSNHDGIFDAPVAGTYAFAITVVPARFKWVIYEIVSDGTVLGGAIGDSEDLDSHSPGSITIVVNLRLGDHVYVRRTGASDSCASYSEVPFVTSFAGWLIG